MREEKPDVVLLDINFPPDMANGCGWDGLTLMRWLRSFGFKVPVYIMSATDDVKVAEAVVKAGAAGFIAKPFSYGELRKMLFRSTGLELRVDGLLQV